MLRNSRIMFNIVVICPPKSQLGLMLYILGCKDNMAKLEDSADGDPTRTPNLASNTDPISPMNAIANVDLASPSNAPNANPGSPMNAVADVDLASPPKVAADALPASLPNCATKNLSAVDVKEMVLAGLVCGYSENRYTCL